MAKEIVKTIDGREAVSYLKYDGGIIVFDYVFKTDHSINVVTTSHPVMKGAEITDHAYREADEITIEIAYNDTVIGSKSNHSKKAFDVLYTIADERKLLKLVTRFKTYKNMLITSMSVPDDNTTTNALKATLILKEVKIVKVKTVKASSKTSSGKDKNATSTDSDSKGKRYVVSCAAFANRKIWATSVQGAITNAGLRSFTGTVTVDGTTYNVTKGKITSPSYVAPGNKKTEPTTDLGTKGTTKIGLVTVQDKTGKIITTIAKIRTTDDTSKALPTSKSTILATKNDRMVN